MSRRTVLAAGVTLFVFGFLVTTALAGHWLGGPAKKAGDSNVYFELCDLNATVHDKVHDNDSHDLESTNITTFHSHGCTNQDVAIIDAHYGGGDDFGWYECHDFHSTEVCNKGHVHINLSKGRVPEDPGDTLSLVCEEVAHSVGLWHRGSGADNSCLRRPVTWSNRHLDAHDQNTIDDHY